MVRPSSDQVAMVAFSARLRYPPGTTTRAESPREVAIMNPLTDPKASHRPSGEGVGLSTSSVSRLVGCPHVPVALRERSASAAVQPVWRAAVRPHDEQPPAVLGVPVKRDQAPVG